MFALSRITLRPLRWRLFSAWSPQGRMNLQPRNTPMRSRPSSNDGASRSRHRRAIFHPYQNRCTPQWRAPPWCPIQETPLRTGSGIECTRRHFAGSTVAGREQFLEQLRTWLGPAASVETAEFEITSIEEMSSTPAAVRLEIRYDLVMARGQEQREERVGTWRMEWLRDDSAEWKARKWAASEEILSVTRGPVFRDVTAQAFGGTESYQRQMLRGSDYWRTVLDGACGIDVYGNNGVAVGDFDRDGL